jgi:ADP-ribose pyrophosphatase
MTDQKLEKWKLSSSRYVVKNNFMNLRADACITPAGQLVEPFWILEFGDWANCFVIDAQGDVVMVRHYRHGVGDYVLELVSGCIDKTDPSVVAGMTRELEEEIGYVGGEIHPLGVSYPNPAIQTNKVHSFIAIGGACIKEQKLEPGETLFIEKIPFRDFLDVFLHGPAAKELYQSMHLAAIFFALNFIRQSDLESLRAYRSLL